MVQPILLCALVQDGLLLALFHSGSEVEELLWNAEVLVHVKCRVRGYIVEEEPLARSHFRQDDILPVGDL